MKKSIITALVCGFCAVQTIPAADWGSRFSYDAGGQKFRAGETSLDLFGIHASRERDDFRGDTLGLGAGVNHFFTRHFGVGAETYLDDVHWPRHVDASLFARYPLEDLSLAPYGLVGAGRQFHDVAQWTAHAGLGADFRLNRNTGLFTDVRRVFTDKSKDFTLWRLGVRLVF